MLSPMTIRYDIRPRRRSLATSQVGDLFGLAETESPHVVAEDVVLDIRPGDVVLFVGPSGSGKSSLLRAAGAQLSAADAMALDLPDVPIVDAMQGGVSQRLEQLAACGLSEARLLLRTPSELSDGQRYRFRLALTLASNQRFILADEFCAVLDRTLAKTLAFNVRKMASRSGVGFLLATTHDDLLDDLNPDVVVRCLGDGLIEVERRAVKKKRSASLTSFGSRKAPSPTGRTSLGGIIEATGSRSSGGSSCSGIGPSRSACASSAPRPRALHSDRASSD